MTAGHQFTLRFHDDRVREHVRELAAQLGVSQNELIEQAVERDVMFHGAMLADDLERAAKRLHRLSARRRHDLMVRSIDGFAAAEANPDPIRPRADHTAELTDSEAAVADTNAITEAFRTVHEEPTRRPRRPGAAAAPARV